TRRARAAATRCPGRNALLQKYTLLTLPNMKPICQISLLLQSGHQLLPAVGALAALTLARGASAQVTAAITTRGMPQTARLQRQELPTSGSTTRIVSITAPLSATSRPLLLSAVPKPTPSA